MVVHDAPFQNLKPSFILSQTFQTLTSKFVGKIFDSGVNALSGHFIVNLMKLICVIYVSIFL